MIEKQHIKDILSLILLYPSFQTEILSEWYIRICGQNCLLTQVEAYSIRKRDMTQGRSIDNL